MSNWQRTKRLSKNLSPSPAILIVCEGEKTEPYYFGALKQKYGLTAVDIIHSPRGSAPISVVDSAIDLVKQRKREVKQKNQVLNYKSVWCVIDVERLCKNASFMQAINKAKSHEISLALSNKCFEYWMYLHFCRKAPPSQDCDAVKKTLKQAYPDYDKTDSTVISRIALDFGDTAVENAKSLEKSNKWQTTPIWKTNPSTNVHHLVEFLKKSAQ